MSGGGGSGSDGSGDMQVSGAEAAYSQEKGISTQAESRVGPSQASRDRDNYSSMDNEEQAVYDARKGPDTSTVGDVGRNGIDYSSLDQEGQAEFDRGQTINQGTKQQENLSFKEHWANRPAAIKWSPTLSLLYAGGKNIGEWFGNKNWGSTNPNITFSEDSGDGERARMNAVAPHAPYIVSGTTKPTNSPALNWYQNLGTTNTNTSGFDLATEYAAAKSKVAKTLGTSTPVGQLAVNDTPYFNFLKKNNLDKGIL